MVFCFFQPFFEKMAGSHIPILTISCPVHLVYLHVRSTKQANLYPIISPLDFSDYGDCPIYIL